MKKFFHNLSGTMRWLAVAGVSIVVVSVGIRASDNARFFTASMVLKGGESERCPEGMVFVSSGTGGFCIDAYEASVDASLCPVQNPVNQSETRNNIDTPTCKPTSVAGAMPWRNISQNQAAVACAKAGKHLATNKEWYQASLGTPDKDGGWGLDDCNVNANHGESGTQTGAGRNCVSAAGAYDMIGNAWEWTNDTAAGGEYKGVALPEDGYVREVDGDGVPTKTSTEGDPNYYLDTFGVIREGTRAFMRGGYAKNGSDAGVYMMNLFFAPGGTGESIGFRCAK